MVKATKALKEHLKHYQRMKPLITLKEYLEDYASSDTKEKGVAVIERELDNIPNEAARKTAREYLEKITAGKRDFRF